jgi:AAA domain
MRHYDISQDDIADHLFILSGRDYQLTLAEVGRDRAATIDETAISKLGNTIERLDIDVAVFDPLGRVHHLPESDNSMMEKLMTRLTLLADQTDIAMELVVHTPKGIDRYSEPSAEEARGAVAISNGVRVARVLRRMTREEGNEAGVANHREFFRAFPAKLNMSPPVAESEWFRLTDCDIENSTEEYSADHVGVVKQWQWPDAFFGVNRDKVAAVQQAIRQQPCRAHDSQPDWVGNVIARTLNIELTGKDGKSGLARVKQIIKTWLQEGLLVKVDRKDDHGDLRPYIEVGKSIDDDIPL